MGEGRAPKVGPLEGMQENCRWTRPSSVQACIYKVNCVAREGALGYKVNCVARQGESPAGERGSPGGEGALGYKVNCASRKLMAVSLRTPQIKDSAAVSCDNVVSVSLPSPACRADLSCVSRALYFFSCVRFQASSMGNTALASPSA